MLALCLHTGILFFLLEFAQDLYGNLWFCGPTIPRGSYVVVNIYLWPLQLFQPLYHATSRLTFRMFNMFHMLFGGKYSAYVIGIIFWVCYSCPFTICKSLSLMVFHRYCWCVVFVLYIHICILVCLHIHIWVHVGIC